MRTVRISHHCFVQISSKTIIGSISLCKFLVTGIFLGGKQICSCNLSPLFISLLIISLRSPNCASSPHLPSSIRHVPHYRYIVPLFLHLYLLPLPILLLICPSSPRPTPIHRFVISSSSSFPKVLSFLGHC